MFCASALRAFSNRSSRCAFNQASCFLPYDTRVNITNSTGTTNIDIVDEAIIPPSTVHPIVFLDAPPAPVARANGNTPNINAIEVMIMGRKRKRTASRVDCKRGSP